MLGFEPNGEISPVSSLGVGEGKGKCVCVCVCVCVCWTVGRKRENAFRVVLLVATRAGSFFLML